MLVRLTNIITHYENKHITKSRILVAISLILILGTVIYGGYTLKEGRVGQLKQISSTSHVNSGCVGGSSSMIHSDPTTEIKTPYPDAVVKDVIEKKRAFYQNETWISEEGPQLQHQLDIDYQVTMVDGKVMTLRFRWQERWGISPEMLEQLKNNFFIKKGDVWRVFNDPGTLDCFFVHIYREGNLMYSGMFHTHSLDALDLTIGPDIFGHIGIGWGN